MKLLQTQAASKPIEKIDLAVGGVVQYGLSCALKPSSPPFIVWISPAFFSGSFFHGALKTRRCSGLEA